MSSSFWKIFLLMVVISTASTTTSKKKETSSSQTPPQSSTAPFFKAEHTSKPVRVLGVFPFEGYSHHVMSETLMIELAKRGHQVTVISPFPPKEPIPNYVHIDISDVLPKIEDVLTFDSLAAEYEGKDVFEVTRVLADMDGAQLCQSVFHHPKVKVLCTPDHKFDIVFAEIFGSGCNFAFGSKLQVPTIAMVTTHSVQWVSEYNGDINNPSLVENVYLTPTHEGLSSFVERFKNTYFYLATKLSHEIHLTRPAEPVVREFLGENGPTLDEIRKNISLFFVNTHPSIFTPKPLVPNIVPVGGIHLRPPNPKKLPANVKTWLDTAPNGVVYFSLGSILRSDTIPEYLFKAFANAFKELKHLRFLWKFEASAEEAKAAGIPDNVLIVKWLPQMEILSHPNVVAFITHGGLMGTTESIYNGVPMVGMPVFAEQLINIHRYEQLGIATRLEHRAITKEQIVKAVTKITSDPSIRQKAKELSQLFKDRPMSPLDSAIWWTEYVVRNKGAHHLESPIARIPFWQYALLDVAAVVLTALVLVLYILYSILRCLFRCIVRPNARKDSKKKRN